MRTIEDIYNSQIRQYEDVRDFALDAKERINEIHDEIIEDAENAALIEANTSSKTGKWRLWTFLFAFLSWLHETIWVAFKKELDDAATYAQSHTVAWYRQKLIEYQHGDSLSVQNGAVVYSPIVVANRIIKAASVKETISGRLVMKVAKEDINGDLEPLSSVELEGCEAYVSAFKDAGVQTSVVSQNPDVLKLEATVFYLPSQQPLDEFQTAVELTVTNYLKRLTFDGVFRRIALIDALQLLPAFHDIDIVALQASVAYVMTPNFVNIGLEYESVAGYMVVDENFELSTTLTYVPYV